MDKLGEQQDDLQGQVGSKEVVQLAERQRSDEGVFFDEVDQVQVSHVTVAAAIFGQIERGPVRYIADHFSMETKLHDDLHEAVEKVEHPFVQTLPDDECPQNFVELLLAYERVLLHQGLDDTAGQLQVEVGQQQKHALQFPVQQIAWLVIHRQKARVLFVSLLVDPTNQTVTGGLFWREERG